MRILHLPFNIASQISITVRALRSLGHDVRGLVRKVSPIQDCSGVETVDWIGRPNPARRLMRGIHWRLKMIRAVAWADVVHWHWGDSTWKGLDLRIAAALRKPRLVEFWGDDVRDPQIASRDNPFIARMYQRYPEVANLRSRVVQAMFKRSGFEALIPGYELSDYLDASIFPGFYQTRAGLILDDYAPHFPEPDKSRPLLVHCPSNKLKKGTEILLEVLDRLRGSHEFDFRLVHQRPRTEALAITAASDLFLDQFTIGAEGLASHEAMALGKPVICFIKDSLRQRYPSSLPIVIANQETLAKTISELLKDGARRRELGLRGRRYMEEFHDARKIAAELLEIYQDLAKRTQPRRALAEPSLSQYWRPQRIPADCYPARAGPYRRMKRVLLIAFYFPPRNNIACYRSGCFAKFLPQHGWLPTVLCQDWPADRPDSDPDFVGALPDSVEIHRIPSPPEHGLYQRVWLRKLAPYLWPHRAPILWWREARTRLHSLLATNAFDVIWATSDPLTPLALASEGSRTARIPWVADIRDCLNVQAFGSWYKRPFFRHQERRLCRQADCVVTVSDGLANALHQLTARPISVIPNGFDPSLLPKEKLPPARLFTILYAGTLVVGRQDPTPVARALEVCFERGLIPREEAEMLFLGTNPQSVGRILGEFSNSVPVRVLPQVAHRAALALQSQASVLLLLAHAAERGIMTGKVFDYLAVRRPILAVPDDGHTTSRLLQTTGAGVALTGVEPIVRQLSDWYRLWRSDPYFTTKRNEDEIGRYSRCQQTGELARILNQVTSTRPIPAMGSAPLQATAVSRQQ